MLKAFGNLIKMNAYTSNKNTNWNNKIDISITDKTYTSSYNKAKFCCAKVFNQCKLDLN